MYLLTFHGTYEPRYMVESYTNSLNVISDNILEVCRNLHTFIIHSRYGCIIFDRKIKLIIFKIKFQTTYTTISNTHYFPCQTGHFYPRVINSGIWLLLTYPNFWLRSLSIDSLISEIFFSTKSLPPGLLSPYNQHCSAGKVSQVCACCTSKKVIFYQCPTKVSTKCLLLFQGQNYGDLKSSTLQGSTRGVEECGQRACLGSNKLPQLL